MDTRVKPAYDVFSLATLSRSLSLMCSRFCGRAIGPETHLPLSPNIRGSLFMAVGMASFTMNDAITKAVSSEMNFVQVMLVRGLFATVLIAALALRRRAIRPLRTLTIRPVVLRVAAEVGGTIQFLTGDGALAACQYRSNLSGASVGG